MKRWIGVLGAWWNVRVMLPIEEVEALCFIPDLGCRPGHGIWGGEMFSETGLRQAGLAVPRCLRRGALRVRRASFAAQAALLCFAVVHPSDFLGKAVADVFGAGGHLAQGLKYLSTGGSG